MKIIGLTGSIGMGKSLAAAMVRGLRVPVFDSDAYVHGLLDGLAVDAILKVFPSVCDPITGKINRKKLGGIVFSDPVARKVLETILHPLVWEGQRKFIAKARRSGQKQVVLDIPLLFETGRERRCDAVLCVTAPLFLQRSRVLGRSGMTEEKFRSILTQQMPDSEKRRRADWVIPTGAGRAFTLQKLKKALRLFSS